uniref:Transmembrane protein 91 n=1 Tax=Laticauda laticaudata TaxID=8630 RepID=A0A8C5RDW1_LATLA
MDNSFTSSLGQPPFPGTCSKLCSQIAFRNETVSLKQVKHPIVSLTDHLLRMQHLHDVIVAWLSPHGKSRLLPTALQNDSSSDSDTESENSFSMLQPQDYLGLAVFSMLCCFWPLGIAAFYLSQKTNKASAMGDYSRAWTASRQTFALAVLSIILGICTYIGAVVALIAYLSNKAPT